MTDATKPAGDLVQSLRSLGADFRSHSVANGTIERTEEAGELMYEAADEIDRLTAALADRERAIAEAVPVVDEALRLAAERTRDDLGPTGHNYPAVRKLLDFAERAIRARSGAKD